MKIKLTNILRGRERKKRKLTTTTGGGKKKKIQKNLQKKSKHKNNKFFLESLLPESFPSLGVSRPHLPGRPAILLVSGPAVRQLRFESGPSPMFLASSVHSYQN